MRFPYRTALLASSMFAATLGLSVVPVRPQPAPPPAVGPGTAALRQAQGAVAAAQAEVARAKAAEAALQSAAAQAQAAAAAAMAAVPAVNGTTGTVTFPGGVTLQGVLPAGGTPITGGTGTGTGTGGSTGSGTGTATGTAPPSLAAAFAALNLPAAGAVLALDPENGVTTGPNNAVSSVASLVGTVSFAPANALTLAPTGLAGRPAFASAAGAGALGTTDPATLTALFGTPGGQSTICAAFSAAAAEGSGNFFALVNYNGGNNQSVLAWSRVIPSSNGDGNAVLTYDSQITSYSDVRSTEFALNSVHVACLYYDGTNTGIQIDGGKINSIAGQEGTALKSGPRLGFLDGFSGAMGLAVAYGRNLATSYADLNAVLAAFHARYGTPAPVQAAPVVDQTLVGVQTTINVPTTDTLPLAANAVLGDGLPMTGITPVADVVFGTDSAANVDAAGLRGHFHFNYISGGSYKPGDTAIGSPTDTGQSPGSEPFYARARHYAIGSAYDTMPVSATGVELKAFCTANGNNCGPGQIAAGFLRAPTVFKPGMTLKLRYKSPSGNLSWAPWWVFDGETHVDTQGGTTAQPLVRTGQGQHLHEIDFNDNFKKPNTVTGLQVDYGTPNIYGDDFDVAPYTPYAATGAGYSDGGGYEVLPINWSAAFHDMVVSWDPNTEIISEFADGVLFAQSYLPFKSTCSTYQDSSGATQCVGLAVMIGNQAVPVFNVGSTAVTDNEGSPGAWSMYVREYGVFAGFIPTATASTLIPSGASNAYAFSVPNGPTPPSGQHELTLGPVGTAYAPVAASQHIGTQTLEVKGTYYFTAHDIAQGANLMGRWGGFDDEWRVRINAGRTLGVDVRGHQGGISDGSNDQSVYINSTAPYGFEPNTFYDIDVTYNPATGVASFFAAPAGQPLTQVGAANVPGAYASMDVFQHTVGRIHIGQGNNETRSGNQPSDGNNALWGGFTKATLLIGGTPVLAPVVTASAITDATPGVQPWGVVLPPSGSAEFDSYTLPGGPAQPPPAPVTVTYAGATFAPTPLYDPSYSTTGGGGASPVQLAMKPVPGYQPAGNVTPMTGTGTWNFLLAMGFPAYNYYEGGVELLSADGSQNVKLRLQYPNSTQGYVGVDGSNAAVSNLGNANQTVAANGGPFWMRVVRDASNMTFSIAGPDGAAGSWIQIAQVPLSSLPAAMTQIGFYLDAWDPSNTGYSASMTVSGYSSTTATDPQAAAP